MAAMQGAHHVIHLI